MWIYNLISHTLHSQIFNLAQHINKLLGKLDYQTKMLQSTHNSDRESQDQGVIFFRKQFYQKQHANRSNLKCSRHIKFTTDSKMPFSMLGIIGYKNYPIYGKLSWHTRQSKPPIFNISLFFGCTKKWTTNKWFHLW